MTAKLYEDLLTEKVAETTFNALLKKTRAEQELLEQQIAEAESAGEEEQETDSRKWRDLIKQYADIQELDAEMLNRLIRKIVVHETIDANGERNITLEIHYNFRPLDETERHQLSHPDADAAGEVV